MDGCIIETERLMLREYTLNDLDALYEIMSDPETMQHYPAPFDMDRTRGWISWNLDNYKRYGFGLWAVTLKGTGTFIGDCGITIQDIDGDMLPEIGYHIHKAHQRQGYAKEAARAVRDWVFGNTDYDVIYSLSGNCHGERHAQGQGISRPEEHHILRIRHHQIPVDRAHRRTTGDLMIIEDNIIRYYMKDVYFITGTAYAGKSTAVKALSERYGMIFCGENYDMAVSDIVAEPDVQPDICYMKQLTDWRGFVTRSPQEYERWIRGVANEAAGFEVTKLISLFGQGKVIVDTNIPLDMLHRISDYDHVAVMLSPQSMSVERFFDRNDPEKKFLLDVINSCDDPEAVMENYRRGLALINSKERYDEFANSGFFTLVREDDGRDTREEMLHTLARHFGLET